MKQENRSREYDNYKMPAYDPTIPPNERERLIEEGNKRLRELHETIMARWAQEKTANR